MIYPETYRVATLLAFAHRHHSDCLKDYVPLFAVIVVMTQRELIDYFLNT